MCHAAGPGHTPKDPGLKGAPTMKNQTFGIEIETTGLGCERTAKAIAAPSKFFFRLSSLSIRLSDVNFIMFYHFHARFISCSSLSPLAH